MKKFFGKKQENLIILDGEELKHLAVLRCNVGDDIVCFCNDEFSYNTKIKEISKKQCICEIISTTLCNANPKINITLFQGLPKLDKLEVITQKATELGVSEIYPFESEFTVAKANNNKLERLNKIIYESCKQCGRSKLTKINECVSFQKMLSMLNNYDLVLFANETNKTIKDINFNNAKNIAIIVGSEGGFSPKEIQALQNITTQIGLGERILRTETASIVLCGLVSFLLKN